MSYRLYIKDSGKLLGDVTEAQVQELVDLLEEEDAQDQDYYIDRDILAYLEEEGADKDLLALLRPHVGEADGIEIEWKRD
jgi:hypothetical protein